MKKQRNTYKKWFKTEATQSISVTIKEAEFSRIIKKTCKIGETNKNGTFQIQNWYLIKFFDFFFKPISFSKTINYFS